MNSEKVKEIKEALKQNDGSGIVYAVDYKKRTCKFIHHEDILTLINELESENKELRNVISIANEREYRKKFNDEWRKEYQKELDKQGNGHIAGYPDFDLVYKLYFEQKDQISELEKENELLRNAKVVYETVDYCYEDLKKAEKRIAELEKEIEENAFYSKGYAQGIKNTYEVVIPEKLKEFAERLKNKLFEFFQDNEELDGKISVGPLYVDVIGVEAKDGTIISLGLIDKLLKECLND